MKVWGRAIAILMPPRLPSAMRDAAALVPNSARARLPSRFATANPTLCRVFAKPSPGLPRPTMSLSTRGALPPKNLRTFLLNAEIGPRAEMARVLERSRLLLAPVYGCGAGQGDRVAAATAPSPLVDTYVSSDYHCHQCAGEVQDAERHGRRGRDRSGARDHLPRD